MSKLLNQISEDIGEIKGALASIKETNERQFKLLESQDKRIANLELWKAGMMGKITVIGAIVGGAISIALTFIKEIWNSIKP